MSPLRIFVYYEYIKQNERTRKQDQDQAEHLCSDIPCRYSTDIPSRQI